MSSRRSSYRHNAKKRANQFKKGNTVNSNAPSNLSEASNIVPQDISITYPARITVRPSEEEYEDAMKIVVEDETVNSELLCPTRLRPAIKSKSQLTSNEDSSEENVVVNFHKLSSLVAGFLHKCARPCPEVRIEKRKGLCITAKTYCKFCKFQSEPIDLFTSILKRRGPTAGSLNDALAIPVLKSKMGVSDITYLFSCLNIQPPAPSGLHKIVCKASDKMIELNQASMNKNQEYVKKVLEMSGREAEVNVETDLSFNNRPQSGYEAATQSFCPMVEQDTSKKLVLSLATANKLCAKRNCNHGNNNNNCRKNFGTAESIASSESKLVHENLDNIDSNGALKVKSVTSDASAQIEKSVRNYAHTKKKQILHFKCFVHKLRTFQKHIRYTRLTSKLPGCDKEIYSRQLSKAIRARVRLELVRNRKFYKNTNYFISHALLAVKNILPCFSGNHINCRQNSMVCKAYCISYNTNFLPYNKHLELNCADMARLQTLIENDFSRANLQSICRLSNTNRSESLHHMAFTYAPKCTVWSRNFTGLCHSAVHSSTLGCGQSSLSLATETGIRYKSTDPFFKQMKKIRFYPQIPLPEEILSAVQAFKTSCEKEKVHSKMKDNSFIYNCNCNCVK